MTTKHINLLLATVALSLSATAQASGSFTALGGFGAGSTFAIETSVSGHVLASDGSAVHHGAMPLATEVLSGIKAISAEYNNDAPIYIYSLDGRFITSYAADESDFETLNAGVYIVRQGSNARKIVKPAK